MMNSLDRSPAMALPPAAGLLCPEPYPPERHPVLAYLARLSPGSGRDTVRRRLNIAATLLSGGRVDALDLPWHRLTYVHVLALRSKLSETLAFQTVNVTLFAVKGVLKECWRLEHMPSEAMLRACDVSTVKRVRLPKGRC